MENNNVLIIGPNYFNYLKAASSAFERCGYSVTIDAYDTPIHPYTTLMKWCYKITPNRNGLQNKSRQRYNTHIKEIFDSIKPKYVFVMNGEILFTETLDYFRGCAKVAVWLYDNLDRLPDSKNHIDHVDVMCCFEQEDVDFYKNQGKKVFFLPQGCDTETYHPLEVEKDIDISFVGNIYYSKKRRKTLNAVIDHFPNKKIVIYGIQQPWFKSLWKWATREHRSIYKNCMISSDEVNMLYNRSKVVLNIHQELQKQGANPRTFEIIGSGAYQICDANPYIETLFKDGEIGVYRNFEELFTLINEGLKSNKSESIAKARECVLANHSFNQRIKKVIEWLDIKK